MANIVRQVSLDSLDEENAEKQRVKQFILKLREQTMGYEESFRDPNVLFISERTGGGMLYDNHPSIKRLIGERFTKIFSFECSGDFMTDHNEDHWKAVVWDAERNICVRMSMKGARKHFPTVMAHALVLQGYPAFHEFMHWCCNENILPTHDYNGPDILGNVS